MIKVGLIGCGKISERHISAFSKIREAKITAVCDISPERTAHAAELTGAETYSDYINMLDAADIDLAVVNLPHSMHNPCVCACAERNIDVFLEKPMGISEKDCNEIIAACEKTGIMLWVGHGQSFEPVNIKAKEIVESGKLGELVSVMETRNTVYFRKDRPRWFLDKSISGGGIMVNLGAHTLDRIKFFAGGEIQYAFGGIHIPEGMTVENNVQAFVRTTTGVNGVINLVGHTAAYQYITVLYLTCGEIRIYDDDTIEVIDRNGDRERIDCGCGLSEMDLQMKCLVETKLTGNKPRISGDYGKDIIRAIESIYNTESTVSSIG